MIQSLRYIIFWSLTGIIVFTYCIYHRKKKNAHSLIICIGALACTAILFSVHIENLFLQYNSPQTAFINSGQKGSIYYTIESENSTLVLAKNDSDDVVFLLEKDGEKWKVPLTQNTHSTAGTMGIITAVNEKNTNNYYFVLFLFDISVNMLSDSYGTTFENFETSDTVYSDIEKAYTYEAGYVGFVENVSNDYRIFMGNNELNIVSLLNLELE